MSSWIVALGALIASMAGPQPGPAPLHVYRADRQASRLYVVTHKTGLLSFLGHEHAIVPTVWNADLCLADPIPAGAHARREPGIDRYPPLRPTRLRHPARVRRRGGQGRQRR